MVLDFSLELQVIKATCKEAKGRLKEKQEGKPGINHVYALGQAVFCL